MTHSSRHALPQEVEELAPRMREIASIVYWTGGATLKEVQQAIDPDLTVYGIRTLLNRLIRRGVVKSRPSGRHSEILYLPAIITDDVRSRALARLIEDQFGGSASDALVTAMRMARQAETS